MQVRTRWHRQGDAGTREAVREQVHGDVVARRERVRQFARRSPDAAAMPSPSRPRTFAIPTYLLACA
jgi:hypothetical protein